MAEAEFVKISMPEDAGFAPTKPTSSVGIQARRSGSAVNIIQGSSGGIEVNRSSSSADMLIAVRRRNSGHAMGSVLDVFLPDDKVKNSSVPDAKTALNAPRQYEVPIPPSKRQKQWWCFGKARETEVVEESEPHFEHQWPFETVAEKFHTHIDFTDPSKSRGLTAAKAKELLRPQEEGGYGPNLLTPPPRTPLWYVHFLSYT